MNNLHTLTALTGRDAARHRTVVIQGFEASRATVVTVAILALPTLLVTAVSWSLVGQYGLLVGAGVFGAGWWLIATTSRRGLQRRTFEALLDKRRSDAGQFYMCGRVIDPDLNELGVLMSATVPAPDRATTTTTGPAVSTPLPVAGQAAGPVPPPDPVPFDPGDLFATVSR